MIPHPLTFTEQSPQRQEGKFSGGAFRSNMLSAVILINLSCAVTVLDIVSVTSRCGCFSVNFLSCLVFY